MAKPHNHIIVAIMIIIMLSNLKVFSVVFLKYYTSSIQVGFPGGSVIKNPPANAGNMGLIPKSGRSPGEK